jgi:nucleotide-binding universal stress UspA family protein
VSIIVGYDGSRGSVKALHVACGVASAVGEPLVLVYGAAPPGGGIAGEEYTAHLAALRQMGTSVLEEGVETAREAGLEATVEVTDEKPAPALMGAAERHRARFIVVGSWGESLLRGALLGSTPYKLLHESRVPLICVPVH